MAGSGRRGTDWEQARDFWIALGPRRSFERVGKKFGVSAQRVGYVARRDGWHPLAAEIDARALEQTKRRIVRSRADRVAKTLGLIDGALDVYDNELEAKAREGRLRDMSDLVKLAELLEGEATDRPDVGEWQAGYEQLMQIGVQAITEGWSVIEYLERVRGRLGEIGEAA